VKRKLVKENLDNIRLAFGINVIVLLQDLTITPEMLLIVTRLLLSNFWQNKKAVLLGGFFNY
jgi:hypothetical protein